MIMERISVRIAMLVILMGAVSILAVGCTKGGDSAGGGNGAEQHAPNNKGAEAPKDGMVGPLKEKKLADYSASTIGHAFDSYSYFEKRDWKETRSANGKIYIDFQGWFKKSALDDASIKRGIVARGVEVKFVINPDGSFYLAMISKTEIGADGQAHGYPLGDQKSILDAVYGNREISF